MLLLRVGFLKIFILKNLCYLRHLDTKVLSKYLKVHKIENFFDSDFGICVISLLAMSKILRFYKKKILLGHY